MKTRIGLIAVWLAFIGYALVFAPGARGASDPVMLELITLRSKEPMLLAMFSLLGLFPMAFACLLLRADRGRIPAWPFVLGTFGLGSFALLPYFWLSDGKQTRTPRRTLRAVRQPAVHAVIAVITAVCLIGGVASGHFAVYADAFHHSQFVHVMTLDFVLLTLLSVFAIGRDAQRRGKRTIWMWWGLVPIIGVFVYLNFNNKERALTKR